MRTVRRSSSIILAAGLTATLLAPSVSSAAPASLPCAGRASKTNESYLRHNGSMEQITVKTLHIVAEAPKQSVAIKKMASIKVNVTRPAEEDPLGQGIPMDRPYVMAAEEVNVGVGLLIGDVFLPGFAITDANGDATIKIKIERYVKPGPVDAAFYAWETTAETPCATVQENGFRPYQNFFRVTR
ncbi:MAG: hypothetical protein ACR2KQ_06765 [Actinomycetota bacterium]